MREMFSLLPRPVRADCVWTLGSGHPVLARGHSSVSAVDPGKADGRLLSFFVPGTYTYYTIIDRGGPSRQLYTRHKRVPYTKLSEM